MLKLLLKKQLFEIFRSYFYDAKKNKARSRLATALYIGLFVLLMAGILGGIFTLLAVKLCGPLAAAGLDWLYFALMGLIAVLLGALAGLTLGVKMPVLTWTDQLMPIKQSAPVMLTLFGGMGYTILLFAGFLLLPGWRLGFAGYAACFAAANLLLCAVLHRWLRKKGAALCAAL